MTPETPLPKSLALMLLLPFITRVPALTTPEPPVFEVMRVRSSRTSRPVLKTPLATAVRKEGYRPVLSLTTLRPSIRSTPSL